MLEVCVLQTVNLHLAEGVKRNVVVGRQNSDKVVLLIARKCDDVGCAVYCVSCSLSTASIERLTCHTARSHILYRISVGRTDRLNIRSGRCTLNICSRKVCCIVADDCSHAGFLVCVVSHGLGTFRYFVSDRELIQSSELRINLVVGLRLDVVQLSRKEDRSIICAIKSAKSILLECRHQIRCL